ncbi:hypothetical protein FQN51_000766 [Onygenales sp. PD_10]|nr:hypothetical protein FQN51_000766 [Onygenales sp. PD_10]
MVSKSRPSKQEFIHSWLDEVVDSPQQWPWQPTFLQNSRTNLQKRGRSDVPAAPSKKVNLTGPKTNRAGRKGKGRGKSNQVQSDRDDDKYEHGSDTGLSSYVTESRHSSAKTSTRLQRFWLGFATPRVHFVPFGEQDRPQFVTELFRDLVKGNEQPVPDSLQKLVKERYPADFMLSTENLSDADPLPHEFQLWEIMTTAFDEATKAQRKVYDENGWSRVAKALLEGSMNVAIPDSTRPRMFESLDVQTVSIGPVSILPVFDGHPIPFKKVDFSVSFSRDDPEVGRLYNNINRHPDILLSQTEDPLVGYVSQLVAIEIKSSDGGYDSSSLQLATWLPAGLENMRLLLERAREAQGIQGEDEIELLPFIGITAVGHPLKEKTAMWSVIDFHVSKTKQIWAEY